MKVSALKTKLEKMGVKVCGTADEFYDREETNDNLWVSLETGALAEYDIHGDRFHESEINKTIQEAGFFLEPYDGGTAMIWE